MTISLSKKQLQQSISRIRKCADGLGIRLGKGEDKAQKLICSVLDMPNWHVALAKSNDAKNNAPFYDSMSKFRQITEDALQTDMVKNIDKESFICVLLERYKTMDSVIEFASETPDVLKVIKIMCEHSSEEKLSHFNNEYRKEKISNLMLVDYYFSRLLTEVPEIFSANSTKTAVLSVAMIAKQIETFK